MEPKPTIPTDNIYKFYALFGLTLLITSILSIVYITNQSNQIIFENAIEYSVLKSSTHLSIADQTKLEIIERKLEVAREDRKFEISFVSVLATIAIFSMAYGFQKWHTVIQPKQDLLLDLQIKKAKADLRKKL